MNNTKWNEIFNAFYNNESNKNPVLIRWRTKDKETGHISDWDGTWTHFGCEPRNWDKIDYLQIELTEKNCDYVIQQLKQIPVPGIVYEKTATIALNKNLNKEQKKRQCNIRLHRRQEIYNMLL